MSLTTRVVLSLIAGLTLGIIVAAVNEPHLNSAVTFLQPIGTLWVNAIRMTVIPLIFSLLVVSVASASSAAAIGRIGVQTVGLFLLLLAGSALVAVVVLPPLYSLLRIDPTVAASVRTTASSTAAEAAKHLPPFSQWLTDLIPINPVKAASEGTMLPLVIFTALFGAAATRTTPETRDTIVRFFRATGETMLVLVRWVIDLAPVGVFVLALGLAAKLGAAAAGAVGFYVLVTCSVMLLELSLLYPIAVIGGRMPLRRFAKSISSAQAVALSTRSSLATLPALLESARRGLGLRDDVAGFVLPFGVSTFKLSVPPTQVSAVLFIGALYGIHISAQQILIVALVAIALSFTAPGIPGGGMIILAPVFASMGLPVEGLGILIAVDIFPDTARGVVNVSADITVATLLTRKDRAVAQLAPATTA
ncbi:MAG TPA: dicarboxylate/amino acid:cation symporter [Gemmatimonadaceae bacterium]|nr:dicarboxylate/amino acid:cation symporter [Gemmatimonadaceae bacterium]